MRDSNHNEFISGIYNYCDRWCERCSLISRCLLYAKDQQRLVEHRKKGENPYSWKMVLQDVERNFNEAIQLIHKIAKEQGIDLESLQNEEEYNLPDPSGHPLYQHSHNYMLMAHEFLKKLRESIQAKGIDLSEHIEDTSPSIHDIETLQEIISCYETVSWYHTLIPAKIYRALTREKNDVEELAQTVQNDANGSAKVAYQGLVKSIAALRRIYEWDESLKDSALTLLAEADRVCRCIDTEFPKHREFKRPGFDDFME